MVRNSYYISSPIQTITVGPRLTLGQPRLHVGHGLQLYVVTVGRDFHPAPKKSIQFSIVILLPGFRKRNHYFYKY